MTGAKHQTHSEESGAVDERPDFVKAVNHPLRVQMLAIWTSRAASPSELSEELDVAVGNINYHARKLEKMGIVEIVRERRVRGATEHFYRATERPWFSYEQWMRLSPDVRAVASAWTLETLIAEVAASLNAGTFDARPERHLSRSPVVFDELGWRRANQILEEACDLILSVSAESAARINETGEPGFSAVVGMFAFEPAPVLPKGT